MIHIGFTGTRHGMTPQQMAIVSYVIGRIVVAHVGRVPFTAHHGDCVGADAQFHDLCRQRDFRVVSHPPTDQTHRAHKVVDESWPPAPYLRRNRAIVNVSQFMIATPAEATEQTRGGTWSTVRYARKCDRPLALCLPDGRVEWERWP